MLIVAEYIRIAYFCQSIQKYICKTKPKTDYEI